ncbi:MAG: glycosyltransferase family 4 protein [Pseudomonadota bacterium]
MPETTKRILVSVNTSWNLITFRKGLLSALVDAGYDVIAAAPEDDRSAELSALGVRYVPLPMDNKGVSPSRDLMLFLRYWRLFRKEKPDVYLGYTIKPNIYGNLAARLLNLPAINNVTGLGTAFIRENWVTRIVRILYRTSFQSANTVFFQNEDDLKLFLDQRLVRSEKTQILPGSGINLSHYVPPEKATTDETDPTSFLMIARLLWDKGVAEFVEAARKIKAAHPDTQFRLLGFLDVENQTAVPRQAVDQWVSEGIIDYLGTAKNVRPHIADSDCVVLPSYREGTPRTLLEAAAMARPLIATDVPGCRQVVDHDESGYLCEVRSADALAESMTRFLALPDSQRARMGLAGRAKMEREYDERIVIERYLDRIQNALNARMM